MWTRPPYGKPGADIESGSPPLLYPMMLEPPELRWAFIRKIYSILSIQLLLSVAVSAVVVTVRPISHFFVSSGAGLGIYILLVFLPFIVMIPMYYYHQSYPVNLLLLGLFTVSISFVVGLTCAFTKGQPRRKLRKLLHVSMEVREEAEEGQNKVFQGSFSFFVSFLIIFVVLLKSFFILCRQGNPEEEGQEIEGEKRKEDEIEGKREDKAPGRPEDQIF